VLEEGGHAANQRGRGSYITAVIGSNIHFGFMEVEE
jgi:hypothetical protein